jgi:hypothetical protein
MRILVTILRALTGVTVLIYLVLGLGIGSVLVDGLPPGGWGAPAWVGALPFAFWLAALGLYSSLDGAGRSRLLIVVLAPPLAFAAGVLFGTAPYFWGALLKPLAARWVKP